MIFETIELVTNELLSIETLQLRIDNGEFNDILMSHPFLIMTNKGLCLVQRDSNGDTHVKINAVVDLSEFVTNDNLNAYTKKDDMPIFNFEEDGTLNVTIGNITNRYAPITTT